jgi:hypothetical protein
LVKRLDLRPQRLLLLETLKVEEPPEQGWSTVSMQQCQVTLRPLLRASSQVKSKLQQKAAD